MAARPVPIPPLVAPPKRRKTTKAKPPPEQVERARERAVVPHDPDPDVRTPEERRLDELVGFTIRLVRASVGRREIEQALRDNYGVGSVRASKLIRIAREEMLAAVDANRPYAKAEQIARLKVDLQRLEAMMREDGISRSERAGIIRTRAMTEKLLAELEGNKAPVEQVVRHEFRGALMSVFANLTDERQTELLERARRRKLLAESAPVVVEVKP